MRIPFDALVLGSIVDELKEFVGGRVQGARQPSATECLLELYAHGGDGLFLICVHPEAFRAHFVTRRTPNASTPPQFVSALRSKVVGATLVAVDQPQGDRILRLGFESEVGLYALIVELMGQRSNAILVDEQTHVVAAMKWIGPAKSPRPILPGRIYEPPPTPPATGGSKFYQRLIAATGSTPTAGPVLAPGHGAYPLSVAALGWTEFRRPSLSIALEQHYDAWVGEVELERSRRDLMRQIDRAILAREVSIAELRSARDAEAGATRWQRMGELVLAYGSQSAGGSAMLEAFDYDGTAISIRLDPELDFRENAAVYFDRAKKAKARGPYVRDQLAKTERVLEELVAFRASVEAALRLDEVRRLRDEATQRTWFRVPRSDAKEDPHGGFRIREATGPKGTLILFGDNAEANDHLTMRIAKSDDWWLHVRGHVSAHVLIPTQRRPERVPQVDLEYAARIAASNSNQKHGSYVPVDLTLRKYVRKPRGSARGSVVYTHERTLFVDPFK